jgi:hypothetical protein
VDDQLPRSAHAALRHVEEEVGQRRPEPSRRLPFLPRTTRSRADESASGWREEALRAEHAQDYETAAQLFLTHDEPLRAARLYERAAEEPPRP